MYISQPTEDYLGLSYQSRTIYLSDTDGGEVAGAPDVAVLLHERDAADLAKKSGVAALYLGGLYDTFFQDEQTQAWREWGIPLVALEMRRDGRAVSSEVNRGDLRNLRVRNEEIGKAVDYIKNELGAGRIILIGHSLGSLHAQIWAKEHPEDIAVLVHISPWLDPAISVLGKEKNKCVSDDIGVRLPRMVVATLPAYNHRSLHVEYGGDFYFSPKHKPLKPMCLYSGTFVAVNKIQQEIACGNLCVDIPTFVAYSGKSGNSFMPTQYDLDNKDCFMDVESMRKRTRALSKDLTLVEVPGARHDIAASQSSVRDFFTSEMTSWALDKLEEVA